MQFLVKHVGYKPDSSQKNTVFLIEDRWDDWFRFETMYDLVYIDNYGKLKGIGKVKIAEVRMASDQRRPNIPTEFELLNENFYSLTIRLDCENLNRLGENIRKEILRSLNDIALDTNLFESM